MTKVVFHNMDYWLRLEFWQETLDAGGAVLLLEYQNGRFVSRTITRDEFSALLQGRIGTWVKSEHKSVSVFREALSKKEQIAFNRLYRKAIRVALKAVARQFTARTGAQGKVRLPAEASFVVAIQAQAKDGSPQLHFHAAILNQVRVQGKTAAFATHKRELYTFRKLFSAIVSHDLGRRLTKEFGVRVRKTESGVVLPDVPVSLCQQSSNRTKQIDDYIQTHNLKDTPLSRKFAAFATRRENRDPVMGNQIFQEELARSGFKSAQISNRVVRNQASDVEPQPLRNEIRRIGKLAKAMVRNSGAITPLDLMTRAVESADVRLNFSHIKFATERVIESYQRFGLKQERNRYGQTQFASANIKASIKSVAEKIEFIFRAKDKSKQQSERSESSERLKPEEPPPNSESTKQTESKPSAAVDEVERLSKKVLKSYRVIGAVGRYGIQVAKSLIQIYQELRHPIWHVRGRGHANTPGSIAQMARDLKPLSRGAAHKAAIAGMLRLNASLKQKIMYGEHIYRQSRKPKFRIPRKSLIVIRDVGSANPKDVKFILRKAARAKAKVLFVEREHPHSALSQFAKTMRRGEQRHFPTQQL